MFKQKETKKEEEAEPKAKPAAADVIEAMGDGLIVTDLDGNIISFNRSMEEYLAKLGIDVKEFIGKSALDMPTIRPEDIEKYVGHMKEVIEKGKAGPLEVRDTMGRWSSITASLLKDAEGNPIALFSVVRDITELKRLQEKEKETAAMKMAFDVIEGMVDIVGISDMEGRMTQINKAVEAWGYKKEELIGKPVVAVIAKRSLPKLEEERKKTLETGSMKNLELAGLKKDGSEFPVLVNVTLMKGAEGKPTGRIFALRDITELKRLQEKEKAAAAENARDEEAEKYSKELEKKVKDLEEFHDLAVGRELKMKKMEEEMEELRKRLKVRGG